MCALVCTLVSVCRTRGRGRHVAPLGSPGCGSRRVLLDGVPSCAVTACSRRSRVPPLGAAVGVQLLASTWGVRHVSHPPSRGLRTPGQCRRRLTQVALHEGLEEVGVLESVIAGPPGPCRSQRRVKSRWGPQGHHGVYRTASVSSAVSSAWWTPRGSCPSWGAWFKQATEQRSVRQVTERACSGRCVPRC